jgi:hypothetical protein
VYPRFVPNADAELVVVAITRIKKATCDEEKEGMLWRRKVEIYKRGGRRAISTRTVNAKFLTSKV